MAIHYVLMGLSLVFFGGEGLRSQPLSGAKFKLGVIEIAVAILFLIPRTSFVGAILVTGYLGGAVWAHLRVGDARFFPIIIGVVMWIALGLRQPAIFALAMGKLPGTSNSERNTP